MSDDAIFAALTKLTDGMDAIRADIGGLRTDLDGLRVDLDGLRTSQTNLRVDLMERMDRLDNQVTGIRDDIIVNMGRVDHVDEALINTRGDVQHLFREMSVMWRQVKRLQSEVRDIRGEAP
jgi:regulator of replication initiation timing